MRQLSNRRFGSITELPLASAVLPITRPELEREFARVTDRLNERTAREDEMRDAVRAKGGTPASGYTGETCSLMLRQMHLRRALDTLDANPAATAAHENAVAYGGA